VLERFFSEDFRGLRGGVSHDRYFLDRTSTACSGSRNGLLSALRCNYSAYLRPKAAPGTRRRPPNGGREPQGSQAGAPSKPPVKALRNRPSAKAMETRRWCVEDEPRRSFSKPRNKRLEGQLPRLEAQRSQLEQQLWRR